MSTQSLLLDLPPLTAVIDHHPCQLQSNEDLLTAIKLMDKSAPGKYLLIMADQVFLGIFTDRDVVKAVATDQDLANTTLADLLPIQSIALTMDVDQTILTALAVLYRHQLAYLPVVTVTGQVVGVVTQTTLLQTLNRVEERTATVALVNAQLEQEIAERLKMEASLQETSIIMREQHKQNFLRAQRLEILGSLASGIAHDMNNIFTPILAAAQLLPRAIPDLHGRGLRLVKMLEEGAHRGTDLVQQILAFAQGTESEHLPIEIIPVLTSVLSVVRQTFPGSIEVIEDFADQPLRLVMADSTQIHQVLMNLFVNARDAMPHGGQLKITARNLDLDANAVHIHPDANSGAYVTVIISDTGTGIAPEHLEKIFDPFFTTKGVERGTGLGLSTAATILKNHSGFLLVNSTVGHGSDFQVCLPCEN
jgi:signal transduction histidine kinase